jgi:hypothetical protein
MRIKKSKFNPFISKFFSRRKNPYMRCELTSSFGYYFFVTAHSLNYSIYLTNLESKSAVEQRRL